MSHERRRRHASAPLRIIRVLPVLILLISATLARGQTITEYRIPTHDSQPSSITSGPDGALWFTETGASKIGRISADGAITEFVIARSPQGIAAGPDGNLWFTAAQFIGRISTAGEVTLLPASEIDSFWDITAGPDGNLWFTDIRGKVGRVTSNGVVTLFPAPVASNLGPYGIARGADGNLWYTTRDGDSIGRITPSGVTSEFGVPPPPSSPIAITTGPDGALWFTASNAFSNGIGRMTTSGLDTRMFTLPKPDADVFGIAAGADGNLWFTENFGSKIGRITTDGRITEYALPTASAGPRGITAGPDGNIWFVEHDGNKIGRITAAGASPTCTPDEHTLCLNNGRFSVTAAFQLTPSGPAFEATGVRLTDDTGYFWFFSADNVEVVVKVLNACVDPFHSYWVFAAGLTNVEVVLTVTDTQKGQTKRYTNPLGTPFQPIQDTSAFATCP